MNKVTAINLGGQVYQLDEHGYKALRNYLDTAEESLAENPDKTELMTDLELALADKLARFIHDENRIVNEDQVKKILEQMGPVESDERATETKTETASKEHQKRLFVIRDGAVALGVCKGLGAYFGIDANVVRILFVVLTALTSGFWIIVYLILALVLPSAKTDEEIAEAYGRPVTAQDIINRARNTAPNPEAVDDIVGLAKKLLHIAVEVIHVVAGMLLGIATFAWLAALWQFVLGNLHMHGQLRLISGWQEALAIIAAYVAVAVPLFLIFRIFGRISDRRKQNRASTISETSAAVLWGMAIVTIIVLGVAHGSAVRSYVNSHHGYMNVGNHHFCVNRKKCDM